jgi:hypothetical protein
MSEQNALVSPGGAQVTSSEHFVNIGMDFVQKADALLFGAPPSSFNFQGSQIHIKFVTVYEVRTLRALS